MAKRKIIKRTGTIGNKKETKISAKNFWNTSSVLITIDDKPIPINSIAELKKFINLCNEVLTEYDNEQAERKPTQEKKDSIMNAMHKHNMNLKSDSEK